MSRRFFEVTGKVRAAEGEALEPVAFADRGFRRVKLDDEVIRPAVAEVLDGIAAAACDAPPSHVWWHTLTDSLQRGSGVGAIGLFDPFSKVV